MLCEQENSIMPLFNFTRRWETTARSAQSDTPTAETDTLSESQSAVRTSAGVNFEPASARYVLTHNTLVYPCGVTFGPDGIGIVDDMITNDICQSLGTQILVPTWGVEWGIKNRG